MSADNWTVCPKCGSDFREDYEIGTNEGVFFASYHGSCGSRQQKGCGFEFRFEKTEDLKGKSNDRNPRKEAVRC